MAKRRQRRQSSSGATSTPAEFEIPPHGNEVSASCDLSSEAFATPSPLIEIYRSDRPVPRRQITAQVIADRIVDFCHEHGEPITNLRLQKLLYYSQAWHLGFTGKPLFPDRLEAWVHGPAQPEVFAHFSPFASQPIDRPPTGVKLPASAESHLNEVLAAYSGLSAFDLERLSQRDRPWQDARRGLANDDPATPVIAVGRLRVHYRQQANEQKKQKNTPTRARRRKDT